VVLVEGSGVVVHGVSVERDKPGLVGGRVEVMKTDLVAAGVSSETLMHEPRLSPTMDSKIQIFFMMGFYLGNINASATDLSMDAPWSRHRAAEWEGQVCAERSTVETQRKPNNSASRCLCGKEFNAQGSAKTRA
jgi:hypothetical protein